MGRKLAFGPYRTLDTLGRGGMGVVYEALDTRNGERVALKTVTEVDVHLLGSMRREIQALQRLSHPGIVPILDEGVAKGVPWYSMRLTTGMTLAEYSAAVADLGDSEAEPSLEPADDTPTSVLADLPEKEPLKESPTARFSAAAGGALPIVLTLVRRLCHPLAYLHGEGLVHRDLKPQNVLVQPSGAPVIIDFGLSAQFAGAGSRETLGQAATASGTLGYMAPEQLRGGQVDARADLYALGCILFDLLVGEPPFIGDSPAAMASQHLFAEVPSPAALVDGVPADLDLLVRRLLEKDPRARIGYADDVARALGELGGANGAFPGAPRSRTYLYRPTLAGRSDEQTRFDELLDALKQGRPSFTILLGDSGVGKTRLMSELASRATEQRIRVLQSESLPDQEGPLRGLSGVLRAMADRCRAQGAAETAQLLGPKVRVLADYHLDLTDVPGFTGYPPPTELKGDGGRLRALSYLVDVLRGWAQREPLLLILDDVHWADELTLDAITHLERALRSRPVPLAVLASCRPEVPPALDAWTRLDTVETLSLSGLGEAEVEGIVREILALDASPEPLVRFLARQSEGNPLFVGEYLRAAVDLGVLARDDAGRWRLDGDDLEALPVPRSLAELILSQLDGLSPSAHRMLELVAVFGRECRAGLLERAAALSSEQFIDSLLELRRFGLITEEGDLVRFEHDKVREVLYESLNDRADLHRRVAAVLEETLPNGDSGARAELAHHWEAAGERVRARSGYLAAARLAAERYAHGQCDRLFRRYLALLDAECAESLIGRLDIWCPTLHRLNRTDEQMAELRTAVRIAEDLQERTLQARGIGNLATTLGLKGRVDEARALNLEALALYRKLGNRRGEAHILGSLGNLSYYCGRMEEAEEANLQALALHRETGDREAEGAVLLDLGNLHADAEEWKQAHQCFEEGLAILREQGERLLEAKILANLGNLHLNRFHHDEARRSYEAAVAIAREVGDRRFEGHITGNLGNLAHLEGRTEEARLQFEKALDIARQSGERRVEAAWLGNLGECVRDLGRVDEAETLIDEAITVTRQAGDRRYEGIWLDRRAELIFDAGGWDEAEETWRAALQTSRETNDNEVRRCSLRGIGLVRFARGEVAEALTHLESELSDDGVALGMRARMELLRAGDRERPAELLNQAEQKLRDAVDPRVRARISCWRVHLELAAGRDTGPLQEQLLELRSTGRPRPTHRLRHDLDRAERALAAAAAGEPLVCGHHPDDITAGQRTWLKRYRPEAIPDSVKW